jgi:FixJ family two-component response regulator
VSSKTPIVYLVDDDPSVLKSMTRLLTVEGFKTSAFSSPHKFLEEHDISAPGCIVMDLAMPELSGLSLQKMLSSFSYSKPVVFISGRGDVPSSVSAMKAGAVDFLTKPFTKDNLLTAVREALRRDKIARESYSEREENEQRLSSLTEREREVFDRVIRGMLNKQIASDLGIVEKTVKVHRGRMMKKMGVRSVAKLVQLAERLDLIEPEAQ